MNHSNNLFFVQKSLTSHSKFETIKSYNMTKISSTNFAGKKAIIRVDFNVPFSKTTGEITDDTRIVAAIPTIKKVIGDGGAAIIMTHLGRPDGEINPKYTTKAVQAHLAKLLGVEVIFATDCVGADAKAKAAALKGGQVLLLENLRFHLEEEGKPKVAEGTPDEEVKALKADMKAKQKVFSQDLANHADYYINDAFGTAHRAHASTAVIADYFDADHKMFGFLIEEELGSLERVLAKPEKPVTAIMGGSKVSTKITIIMNLLDKVDYLILGGAMVFTFIKAHGGKIGSSLVEDDCLQLALDIEAKAKAKGVKLLLATDQVIADKFAADANTKVVAIDAIPEGWLGLDAGPATIAEYKAAILASKTILWNGPVGVFEMPAFEAGSRAVADAVAEATKNGAYSLVGGGDTVSCVNQFNMGDKVSYISTAGGALLEYLEGKVLPGVKAIRGY